jgi:hypothetical protein
MGNHSISGREIEQISFWDWVLYRLAKPKEKSLIMACQHPPNYLFMHRSAPPFDGGQFRCFHIGEAGRQDAFSAPWDVSVLREVV